MMTHKRRDVRSPFCWLFELSEPKIFVSFQSVLATFINPQTIECLVPGHSVGKISLRVSNNGVDYSNALPFEYLSEVTVLKVVPHYALVHGWISVVVTGNGFNALHGLGCHFGDRYARLKFL